MRAPDLLNGPHHDAVLVREPDSQVRLNGRSHPSRHVLERLNSRLGSTVGLMISLGRIGWRGPALVRLLNPCLERQHGRFLIGLQMDILLHAVDVLDTPLDEVAGVSLSMYFVRRMRD